MISSWNIKLFNCLPATVVVIGRPVHRIARITSIFTPQIQDIHICSMSKTVAQLCQQTDLMISHLLLLPWCMAITSYRISSNNNKSQQQPTAGYRQTSKSLPGVSLPRRVKITTNTIYTWQFKYGNTMHNVLYTSNGLICGYIAGIHICV